MIEREAAAQESQQDLLRALAGGHWSASPEGIRSQLERVLGPQGTDAGMSEEEAARHHLVHDLVACPSGFGFEALECPHACSRPECSTCPARPLL